MSVVASDTLRGGRFGEKHEYPFSGNAHIVATADPCLMILRLATTPTHLDHQKSRGDGKAEEIPTIHELREECQGRRVYSVKGGGDQ